MLRSLILAGLLAACGTRPSYRFASPMLGTASLPPRATKPVVDEPAREPIANRTAHAAPIRVAAAPHVREASAAAATAVTELPAAQARRELPAPNRDPQPTPVIRVPTDLRRLVGHRDPREPNAAALGWAYDLGKQLDGEPVAWAEANNRLYDAAEPPQPGDLLVFDRVNSDNPADMIGIVIDRDQRGVAEFLYLGGGVIRRGFVDASRPAMKRDKSGAVVNTFLRTGKRWPLKGSHYLAGEHLAHVIR